MTRRQSDADVETVMAPTVMSLSAAATRGPPATKTNDAGRNFVRLFVTTPGWRAGPRTHADRASDDETETRSGLASPR